MAMGCDNGQGELSREEYLLSEAAEHSSPCEGEPSQMVQEGWMVLDKFQQELEEDLPAGGELYSCLLPADFPVAGAEESEAQLSWGSGEKLLMPGLPWAEEVC